MISRSKPRDDLFVEAKSFINKPSLKRPPLASDIYTIVQEELENMQSETSKSESESSLKTDRTEIIEAAAAIDDHP